MAASQPAHVSAPKPISGPKGYPLVGVLPTFRQNPPEFLRAAARQHGGIAKLDFGLRQVYLITAPDYVKHVLQDNYRNYIRGGSIKSARWLLGNGLALVDGEPWLSQRRLMQPAFHRQRIARLGAGITETIAAMLDRWQAVARAGAPIDIAAEMMRLTLTVIVKTMFSTDISAEVEQLEKAFNIGQAYIYEHGRNPFAPPRWLPLASNRQFRQALTFLDTLIYRLIAQRRREAAERDDLLAMLLAARDEETGQGMSDRQIRDEIMTIFFAGHETTATALAWTWYALAQHPAIEQRIRDELATTFAGTQPTAETVAQLGYMQQTFQEALRRYAPIWIFAREAVAEDQLDGYVIPAKSSIMISPYVTHLDARWWPNPDTFDPERFSAEQSAARPRFAFYPFGGGPHLCIGQSFAMLEAQLILAMTMQQFRLELVDRGPVVTKPQVTLRPRNGLWMRLHPAT